MEKKGVLKRWLRGSPLRDSPLRDRRKARRQALPRLVAYYWDGGAPSAHSVREISSAGLFFLTEDRWHPGTLITMTIQDGEAKDDSRKTSITVRARIVRLDEKGAAAAFAFHETKKPRRGQDTAIQTADKDSLEKFLRQFTAAGPATGGAAQNPQGT